MGTVDPGGARLYFLPPLIFAPESQAFGLPNLIFSVQGLGAPPTFMSVKMAFVALAIHM
jgi:hypothetical protein